MTITKNGSKKRNILIIIGIVLGLLLIFGANMFYNKFSSLKEKCESNKELSSTDDYKYNVVCTKMESNGKSSEGITLMYLYYSLQYNDENKKAYAYATNNIEFDNFENAKTYYFDNISSWMALDYQVELRENGAINLVKKYTTKDILTKTTTDLHNKGFECEKKKKQKMMNKRV